MKRHDRKQEQLQLSFLTGESETLPEGIEAHKAKQYPESPVFGTLTMEDICEDENLTKALKRVMKNKGKPGIDGMKTSELPDFLSKNWPHIREDLLLGTYKPQPVKRVEIPKPAGGVRKLGIPTALDRLVQQMILQVLQSKWDVTFSESSFGFRPGRSAHQAIATAQNYIEEGYGFVVDIDLEKFFDQVNHDALMGRIAKRVKDKRLLKILRSILKSGVMDQGFVSPTKEGTPQGGPLSPLLSNIMLDDLDKELEKRNLRFCRYADDCNIYVKSPRAGRRVMKSIETFITKKLKLRINQDKSAVDKVTNRKFLGFTFYEKKKKKKKKVKGKLRIKRMIAEESVKRFKAKIRHLTRRNRGISLERMVEELASYMKGWLGYFGFCEVKDTLRRLDGWIRRRLRCVIWKQWKTPDARYRGLRGQGISPKAAGRTAYSRKGVWRMSSSPVISKAFRNKYFDSIGLPRLYGKQNT